MPPEPDHRSEIRDFLASRRARVTPEQVGLLPGGGRRRVPGLRREEVAVLAGVSTDWYTRLEKGHINGVSDDVLDAVARALQLDEAERTYLFDLARAGRPANRAPRRRRSTVLPARIQWLLDPTARDFLPDWDGAANVTAALLRTEAGRDPHNKDLRDLVGELSTLSDEFRTRWAAHDVRLHHAGSKQFIHPDVGCVDLVYHSMDVSADGSRTLVMTVYTAEPGTDSEDRLRLLASWAATHATA
jgi:transcriptional regulator with XRE-family HTH domain